MLTVSYGRVPIFSIKAMIIYKFEFCPFAQAGAVFRIFEVICCN